EPGQEPQARVIGPLVLRVELGGEREAEGVDGGERLVPAPAEREAREVALHAGLLPRPVGPGVVVAAVPQAQHPPAGEGQGDRVPVVRRAIDDGVGHGREGEGAHLVGGATGGEEVDRFQGHRRASHVAVRTVPRRGVPWYPTTTTEGPKCSSSRRNNA